MLPVPCQQGARGSHSDQMSECKTEYNTAAQNMERSHPVKHMKAFGQQSHNLGVVAASVKSGIFERHAESARSMSASLTRMSATEHSMRYLPSTTPNYSNTRPTQQLPEFHISVLLPCQVTGYSDFLNPSG